MVFHHYADFYDSLYQDKDYRRECLFVQGLFQSYAGGLALSKVEGVKSILDLGCGTGSHALIFADMGYQVTGVDRSENMLRRAREKSAQQSSQIDFHQADIRQLDLPRKFDAAVAMFTVMGYLTTNRDVEDAIRAVRRHLEPGGLFVFDVWFGPAVLKLRPEDRVKVVEDGDRRIIRYARPVLNVVDHTLEVNYTVLEIAGDRVLAETSESHLMRFYFYQELRYFLEKNGFAVVEMCPFLEPGKQPDENSWNISTICKSV
ncbi:MAG: class I SAM-dependent methyltransferase [Chloroflexi bacterium]|nr:class I SAM-dependent methyltransferase [Chloroflexota bacterium]